jgi:hypothetical protein
MRICGYEGEGTDEVPYLFTVRVKIRALEGGVEIFLSDSYKLANSLRGSIKMYNVPEEDRFMYPRDNATRRRETRARTANKAVMRPYIIRQLAIRFDPLCQATWRRDLRTCAFPIRTRRRHRPQVRMHDLRLRHGRRFTRLYRARQRGPQQRDCIGMSTLWGRLLRRVGGC